MNKILLSPRLVSGAAHADRVRIGSSLKDPAHHMDSSVTVCRTHGLWRRARGHGVWTLREQGSAELTLARTGCRA